jgi:hypothetical protein
LRESYSERQGTELCEWFNYEIENDSPVYLYLVNPWFFDQPLTIANVVRASYTSEQLPQPDEDGRPACAHIPHYYFLFDKPVDACDACREVRPSCKLRFSCNFWFRVDGFRAVPHLKIIPHLYNLEYADGQVSQKGEPYDPVAAACYPVLVDQKKPVDFFRSKPINQVLKSRPPGTQCKIVIEDKRANKFGDEVPNLFDRIARDIEAVTRIESIRMGNFQRNYFAPHPDSNDVVMGYRVLNTPRVHAGLVFRISGTCTTGEEQEVLVNYLNENFT